MIKQKNGLIAGGVVVVLACAWWGLGAYASGKAEDEIVALLDKTGQRDMVRWQSISASPFGSAKLKQVTVGPAGSPIALIDTVKISGLRNTSDRRSGDVTIEGAALPNGTSVLSQTDLARQAGKLDLPPANLRVRWDYQRDDDNAELQLTLEQPEALNAELALSLERVNGAVSLAEDRDALVGLAMMGMMGMGRIDRKLAPLAELRIKSGSLSVKDDGYVQRSVELFKRYNLSAEPGEGNPDKQRAKQFDKLVSDSQKRCEDQKSLAGFDDNDDACQALARFASGDKRTIALTLNPRNGVSIAELLSSANNQSKVFALLAPTLEN
ncbi:Uncharacterised protein [Achromobacter spanius]|uniref:hypothetical protein n=1 Tax=Achromobacter spanius TaxID=217203 RepID=UPI000C2B7EED|nr:hypothetical protein [Achromobacter spanius]AUA56402.1 hypothetical protein CVS48_10345 [Achromobacter spanius]CAB3693317.1 hypothetical protein LMG5911_04603 [Achromobacter spanius]SPT37738.1 Uncharacterised protein [Achromobacter denitrificans]VEE56025.1 Uncharacterised protein [Achromobacter spanius]